jgi:hypothetical protein
MRTIIQSRFLLVLGLGALAVAGVVSACSSSNGNSNNSDSGTEADGSSSGTSSGASSSGSSGSSSSGAGSSSGTSSSSGSSSGVAEGGAEASTTGEGGAEASTTGEGGTCTTVNVYNFDSWCTVSVNGAATVAAATYSPCVSKGESILIAVGPKNGTFELGPDPFVYVSNVGTVADGGGLTSTLNLLVGSTPACVLVCCPFTNGTGCDSSETGFAAFLANCE